MSDDKFYNSLRTHGSRRFLYRLYLVGDSASGGNSRRQRRKRFKLLSEAKDEQLDTLIKLLRRLAKGKLQIHPSHMGAIRKSGLLPH